MADGSRSTDESTESALREQTADELREEAKDAGVSGTSAMRKDDLVQAVADARAGGRGGGEDDGNDDDAAHGPGPDGGGMREGSENSDSLKYSQEISSPDDDPERPGRSLVTTHHDVIRTWAESRGGRPATAEGTEHGDHLGVLRISFGDLPENLREVSWAEWFETFDARRLNFIYQDEKKDGSQSTFHRLENPEREDG